MRRMTIYFCCLTYLTCITLQTFYIYAIVNSDNTYNLENLKIHQRNNNIDRVHDSYTTRIYNSKYHNIMLIFIFPALILLQMKNNTDKNNPKLGTIPFNLFLYFVLCWLSTHGICFSLLSFSFYFVLYYYYFSMYNVNQEENLNS